ncbi:class II glutamine amidotransferase [Asticcacaulis sp. YBE204]|uniref:class II glutamine amidotransferase n=1 Tax=Asticcacaulis sp. YBE204 TaxID=1282363 RepID=UPI0003C3C744|nr:class II glutamine amidotransferase [Asticcacaulis sp. YBE204]ESQ79743.1 transglutaminase [Asticcacaulis sp. YBE204]
MFSDISSDIFAFSFDGLSSPVIDLKFRTGPQKGDHTLGWGLAWYPADNKAAMVAKDPAAKDTTSLKGAMSDWEGFRSTVFFCKVRGAASGYTHLETQPFTRSFAGQDWVFMHNGNLDKEAIKKLHHNTSIFLEPLGRTDSELALVFLLGKIQDYGARTLAEIDHNILLSWFLQLDDLGSADMSISDGVTVAVFYGTNSQASLYYSRLKPPHDTAGFQSDAASFSLNNPRDTFRTAFVFASSPFKSGDWTPMQGGQLIIARRGAMVWTNKKDPLPKLPLPPTQRPESTAAGSPILQGGPLEKITERSALFASVQAQSQQASIVAKLSQMSHVQQNVINAKSITHAADGTALTYRLYDLVHSTEYTYEEAVEHSTHTFRLLPVEDQVQEVIHSTLTISSEGEDVRFEDVFGNQNIHYSIIKPYRQLTVSCRSLVKIFGQAPDDYASTRRQAKLPMSWMPWQLQVMEPYLLLLEMPETQISELLLYARSFAERNGQHLIDTLNDINLTIYRDYQYVPGSTSFSTTPFDVYASRKGVCQDFANLFITLARLLGVPARYRMGYIYTGANYENKIQSDASHAWAEVYIPYIGWRGFDPTNGCQVAQDHIRVACGRNYRDATPTSGTIYRGGGKEGLRVQVTMNEVFL